MKRDICILFMVIMALCVGPVSSQEVKRIGTDELRKEADSVLRQGAARRKIEVVFNLVDRLLEEGSEDAVLYLEEGLEYFPWNLKYQMIYAELLAKGGRPTRARERAELVLEHGETDDLIERARNLLGKEPLPTLDKVGSVPGSNCSVVLVPLMEADVWLLVRIKDRLSAVLGIPVYIQTIEADYPPFARDRRGAVLNGLRKDLKKDIDNFWVAKVLKDSGMTPKDLDDEAKLLRVVKTLMSGEGPEATAQFEAELERSRGKDPQWDSDQLRAVLLRAVKPHRRKKVAYLGITSVDMYAKDYNFLFGWANRRGGVVSYHRFTAAFNDEVPNQERLIKRTLMQCLQSIGHIYGMESCTNPTCARAYPNSLEEHDAKEDTLCPRCRSRFEKIFKQALPSDVPKAGAEK